MKKIAILTSGGDAPGMNSCIYTIFQMCKLNDIELYGVRRGYAGLIEGDIFKIESDNVSNINNLGGSFLGTSRCKAFETKGGRKMAGQNLETLGIDCLIAIGGNGTFAGLDAFREVFPNVIGVPGTIDNDLGYTERTIGFDTAVNNAVDSIDIIRQTMLTNCRISIIETMGRNCGLIALYSATASNADIVITKEKPKTYEEIKHLVLQQLEMGNVAPTLVVAEKLMDVHELATNLEHELSVESRGIVLGYIQRGGSPTVADRILAMRYGVEAVKFAVEEKFGTMLGLNNNEIKGFDLKDFKKFDAKFDEQLYNEFCARNSERI